MDTSETYIKMCEKAEEIQKLAPNPLYSSHDWFVERIRGNVPVWLPRQDQLQDMITDRPMSGLLLDFRDSALAFLWGDGLDSMEQLWVAFVMKEKYNKVWNGEGWIEDIASASTGLDNSTSRRG